MREAPWLDVPWSPVRVRFPVEPASARTQGRLLAICRVVMAAILGLAPLVWGCSEPAAVGSLGAQGSAGPCWDSYMLFSDEGPWSGFCCL